MKILVIGGMGKVGTEVVQALLRRGESAPVLTRNKEAKLPVGAEIEITCQSVRYISYVYRSLVGVLHFDGLAKCCLCIVVQSK